ncbi:TRAP transporter small permease [Roseinatronobacter sp. S2]|uniref:TRAP transporter small permease n=1 Tax=Roseinatronobacter sp. S2 TaxID=3035471 RepID=UPI00240F30DA|nr:TRAP transporter small permease [Roseinatronobacter sp. S2]WFE74643.1 TRAP transporter small permease [Roseinatronobacter sp. S2]
MGMIEKLVLRLDAALQWVLDAFVIFMAGALLVLLNYAVYSRFILNSSVSWGEELPAHMLAALTFIGAAYLTRTNEHLGFDSVVRSLPELMQRLVMGVNLLLMAWLGGVLAWYGGKAALSFGARQLISVDMPIMLFRGAMPLGGALIVLICLVRLAGLMTNRITPNDLMTQSED